MANVPQLMHAGRYYVPAITDASSGYKSQRRDGQKEEEGKTREERQDGGGKRIRKRNREAERKMGRQSEERKERVQKKTRRGSSVGTALPHCHLRLQLQAAGSCTKEKDGTEREKKRAGRIKRNRGRNEGELGNIGRR
jgi:hypothetical protein